MLFRHFWWADWPEMTPLLFFIIGFFLLFVYLYLFELWGFFLPQIRLTIIMHGLVLMRGRLWSPKSFKLTFNWYLIIFNYFSLVLNLLIKVGKIIRYQILSLVRIVFIFLIIVPFTITRSTCYRCFLHFMDLINTIYGMISVNYDCSPLPRSYFLIFLAFKNRVVHGSQTC